MYISENTKFFTFRFSYTHHANVGYSGNVKSRARENRILYNQIKDEADEDASYVIDLPSGGIA